MFLSLILLCVCGLLCGLLESARTAGARCYLQTAVCSSMDSLFSQYHRPMWDRYRIFGMEYLEETKVVEEFQGFLKPYLEEQNWYPFEPEDCSITDLWLLTDDSAAYFEQEIMDYMQYGIWTKEWKEDEAENLFSQVKEAGKVTELSKSMKVQTKEAWKLEEKLETLSACLAKQEEYRKSAASCLSYGDGDGFCREGDRLIRELLKVPGLVADYEKQADKLAEKLQGLREEYDQKSADLTETVQSSFEDELFQYEDYTNQDGVRRRQIVGLSETSGVRVEFVQTVQEEAREVQEYIDSWEPDDEDDELDEAALWRPVQRHFSRYQSLTLPFSAGVQDKEKQGLLEKLRTMMDRGVLSLVLPSGTSLSKAQIPADSLPSGEAAYSERSINMLRRAVIAEYGQVFFSNFCKRAEGGAKTEAKTEAKAGADDSQAGAPIYEQEYILHGQELEEQNLSRTVEELLAVREGLNFIYLLGDNEKRSEARALAMTVVGATGIMPLVSITAFLILSVWAFAEAVSDLKLLLSGQKVPFLKSRSDWKLGLDNMMDFARSGSQELQSGSENGETYGQYLTLLMIFHPTVQVMYRMMDLIQRNLSLKQAGFRMDQCAYRVDITEQARGKHVYFSLGLLKSMTGESDSSYPVSVSAARAY